MAGVSQIPKLFSFTSSAPACPIRSASSVSHVDARSVAQGQAVVVTPHSGLILKPAGPSAVITFGIPYPGRFPIPKVLATPVFGCPPIREITSSPDICARSSSIPAFPSATSARLIFFFPDGQPRSTYLDSGVIPSKVVGSWRCNPGSSSGRLQSGSSS